MDWESVKAELTAAEATAQTNRAMITQSREILKRASDVLDRIRRSRHSQGRRHRTYGLHPGYEPRD